MIQFGEVDTLIVDASVDRIKGGLTSAKVLDRAFKRGTEIYSCPNLHAKIYVFDGTAVIGSSNISASPTDKLLESAVITDEPSLISAARKLIRELQIKSHLLTESDVQRLLKIPVVRRLSRGTKRRAPTINPSPGGTWLVATSPLDMSRFADEEEIAERGKRVAHKLVAMRSSDTNWIRFGKKLNIAQRAQEGDWLIQMSRQKRDGKVVKVFRRAPIRFIQRGAECVRIYWEEFKNSESEALGRVAFKQIAKNAGIPDRRLGKRSIGLLTDSQAGALESLWKTRLKASKNFANELSRG
jgi:hypothetical protein